MRKIGEFLLANERNAAIVALICTLLPLFHLPGGFLVGIIVGLVTLSKGWKSGAIVLAWVALPTVSLLILGKASFFDALFLKCILVWTFALLLRIYGSWRLLLEVVVLVGLLIVSGVHIFVPNLDAWWTQYITHVVKEVGTITAIRLTPEQSQQFIQFLVPLATGMLCAFSFGIILFQLMLARAWQAALTNPGGMRQEFNHIRLGGHTLLLLGIILVGALVKVNLFMDFLPLVLFPFMVAGLSLFHNLAQHHKNLVFLLAAIYIGLLFLPILSIALLVIAGSADSWYDFRARGVGVS